MENELLKISQICGELCIKAQRENNEVYHVFRHIQLVIHNYLEEDGSMVFRK